MARTPAEVGRAVASLLTEQMATILLADFDAETRFELRTARGRGRVARGLALLDKATGIAPDRSVVGGRSKLPTPHGGPVDETSEIYPESL
jgi:hypothetical protein